MSNHRTKTQANEVPQTRADLEQHLAEQIEFLRRSAETYDSGFKAEYKKIAVTLRLLLHDTKFSKSLLGQLNQMSIPFYDTAMPETAGNRFPHGGLVMTYADQQNLEYVPLLDNTPASANKTLPFADWWDMPVFRDNKGKTFTRKELVLSVANKDGGAHVDPALDGEYAELKQGNPMGWKYVSQGVVKRAHSPAEPALRQIAHEVLKTLVPNYKKATPSHGQGIVFCGASLTLHPLPSKTSK
jgi:hypothetical protein